MSTSNGLVDLHCHLDLYPDHQAAVMDAEEAGVFTLAVTTTPRAWPRNHELAQRTRQLGSRMTRHKPTIHAFSRREKVAREA